MDPDLDDTIIGQHRAGLHRRGLGWGGDPLDAVLADTVLGTGQDSAVSAPAEPAAADQRSGVPRHRFRITNDQRVYELGAPTFIGRRPSGPRIAGGVAPQLIHVPSPHKQVSSTHIELSVAGRSVVVTDLRSTNGTVVVIPGSRPRKLRQGESMVLAPGAVVDIGDGNSIEVLPMNSPSELPNDPAGRRRDTDRP